jgi:hypothetical protein
MDETTGFDPTAYHRAPSLTAGTAISLVDALTQTHPKGAPTLAKKTLKKLQGHKVLIIAELASRRQGDAPERSPRQIDDIADNAWRSLRGRLPHPTGVSRVSFMTPAPPGSLGCLS